MTDAARQSANSREDQAPPSQHTTDGEIDSPGRSLGGWAPMDGRTAVAVLLQDVIGEDPSRPGLLETPRRVVEAYRELTIGYKQDPSEFLGVTFPDTTDQMVVLAGIRVVSLCEHHLLPFTGTAAVGYLPHGRVVGLSKLARVVNAYARRLQVQERLTEQIADAIQTHLASLGVGVLIRAHHSCMGLRGAMEADATMSTSALRGVFLSKPEARAEFLDLVRHGG